MEMRGKGQTAGRKVKEKQRQERKDGGSGCSPETPLRVAAHRQGPATPAGLPSAILSS